MTSPDTPSAVLAPCPFCGWTAVVHNIGEDKDCWYVGCSAACSIDPCGTFATEYEAIVAWNSRFFIVPPGYPAYVPLPGDPDYLSQVRAGQGLSLGQMATTLRGVGMRVSFDPVAPTDEEVEAAARACRDITFYALTMDECRDAVRAALTAAYAVRGNKP